MESLKKDGCTVKEIKSKVNEKGVFETKFYIGRIQK
jgi:hypothetical protein